MAIEFLYDLRNKDIVLVEKPNLALSHELAKIREDEFDGNLKAIQEIIESRLANSYPKNRYVIIKDELYVLKRAFRYPVENVPNCSSILESCIRIIECRSKMSFPNVMNGEYR